MSPGGSGGPRTLIDMGTNMQPTDQRNLRILSLVRSESADEWLDRRVVEWATAGKVNGTGRVATGDLYDVACGKRWPLRLLAKLISKALVNGATIAWAYQVVDILREYLDRKSRQLSSEGVNVA